jgi:hypothetical protein
MFCPYSNQHTTSITCYECAFTYFNLLLQADPLELEGLGSGPAITTTMASILPPPGGTVPEPEAPAASDPTSKPELLVMSPMEGPVAAAAVAADEGDKDKNYVPGRPFSADAPPGERPFKYVYIMHFKS